MNAPPKIHVILAPALAADRATSMDLYLANILPAFASVSDRFEFEVVTPPSAASDSWAVKQWQRYVAYPRLLADRLRARPGAVLHVLDQSYGHLCRSDVPTVATCHGLENYRLELPHFWQQALWTYRVRAMNRARRVVVISGDLDRELQQFVGVPKEKITLDYYGVDEIFNPRGALAETLAVRRAANEFLILHVGTNTPRKNIGRLLEAIAHLRAGGLPVRFVKAGTDPREEGHLPLMESLGLLDYFDYLGPLDAPALAAVYRTCHVLAFPSLHEGFGRPIIEAQACGLPLVVADTASAHEIAGAGALTHTPTDALDLAAKIRSAVTEPDTREKLIASGFENVRRFSWTEHVRVLTDIYSDLHGSHPTGQAGLRPVG